MPITIKTANMKYKNSEGEYVGVNAISDNTTAEQLARIEDKGDEVIASIPSDYTALETQVNNIEGMIASEFSTSTAYAIGDLVIYNDHYYRFKKAHPAGAWNASHVDQTTVSGEIISNVTDLKNSIDITNEFIYKIGYNDYSDNVFDGKYIRYTEYNGIQPGNLIIAPNSVYTDFIPLNGASEVTATSIGPIGGAIIAFYDENKNYISGVAADGLSIIVTKKENPPSNSFYVRFSGMTNNADIITKEIVRFIVGSEDKSLTNIAFQSRNDIQNDVDLNDLTQTGYYLLYTGHTYTNAPQFYDGGAAWVFVFTNYVNQFSVQIFFKVNYSYYAIRWRSTISGNIIWFDWRHFRENASNLIGKKISIIGDSISTYNGYIPEGYAYYYPVSGLNNVNDTWWKRVINNTKAELLVNASWSGSWVCYDNSVSEDSAKIAYTDARINALANGTTTPDIIIILMGANDFVHNGGNPIGNLDENSEIPDGSTPITEFKPAYAHMINKVKNQYPNAHVYCCTLIGRYTTTDTEYPIKNTNGVAIANYNKAIIDVASWMGCNIIRLDNIFSLAQIPQYTVDNKLHPNSEGARLIANKIISVLYKNEENYI